MLAWRDCIHRVKHLVRRARYDRELGDEIQFHIDTRAAELERAGLSAPQARRQATREFGAPARVAEDSRAAWQFRWLESIAADGRHAIRGFRRSPAFAATAVICMALGLGTTTLIFSVVNAVLLRSLPYPDPDRLVVVWFTRPDRPDQKFGTNTGVYFTIRERNHVFERIGTARLVNNNFNVAESSIVAGRERVQAQWFSPDMIRVIGIEPQLGRWLREEEAGTIYGITISDGLWRRMFGGTRDVIGKKMQVNDAVATVMGVMPAGYEVLAPSDFWIYQSDRNLRNALHSPNRIFTLIARLKPGVSVEQAQAEMNSLAPVVAAEFPESHTGWQMRVESLHDAYFGHLRQPLLVFQVAVLFVLLIASANVAGLQLAQASTRHRELAMRAALGSSRQRIMLQLLTESVLLSLIGGVLGIALAAAGLQLLASVGPAGLARVGTIALDSRVLGVTLLISIGIGLAFGTLPALQISRPDLMEVLRESGRSATVSKARQRLRSAFVVVQVALAMVLLVGAGLAVNSLLRLSIVQVGFDPRGLLTFQVTSAQPYLPVASRPGGPTGRTRAGDLASTTNTPTGGLLVGVNPRIHVDTEQMRDRIAALAGVQTATLAVTPPLGGEPLRFNFSEAGRLVPQSEREIWAAEWYPIGPEYFRTLRVPLIRGREFGSADSTDSPLVAMVNETMARQFWPNDDPVGKRIQMSVLFDEVREIVGVVGDVRQNRYQHASQPQMYVPRVQLPTRMDMAFNLQTMVTTFVVRTSGDPSALEPSLRSAVAAVSPTMAISKFRTVDDYGSAQLQDLRQYGTLLGLFGGISVALAVVGLFGVTTHAVSQRTTEIGIRRALGADRSAILSLVFGQGLRLIAVGVIVGIAVSMLLTRSIGSVLWGISATDPLTFAAVAAGLAAVALIACYLPARRALKIDPLTALRAD